MSEHTAPPSGEITLVGTGMSAIGHLNAEVRDALMQADVVLYGVSDPATEEWLRRNTRRPMSLVSDYEPATSRLLAYRRMVDRIIDEARAGARVCVALYGHPSVFVFPTQMVLADARRARIPAHVLPNISSLDCLFADLGVDPGTTGLQIHDATTFLVMRPDIDPRVPLILCQVEVLGRADYDDRSNHPQNLRLLRDALLERYPHDHPVVGYDRSFFGDAPATNEVRLDELLDIGEFMTLFVGGVGLLEPDMVLMDRLGLDRALEGPQTMDLFELHEAAGAPPSEAGG